MPRSSRDVDLEHSAVSRMFKALQVALLEGGGTCESKSVAAACDIGEQYLAERQNRVLDRAAEEEDLAPARAVGRARVAPVRTLPKREQDRQLLLQLTTPAMMLAPVNVVTVFLRDQPIWTSWDWSATHAVNTRMLPFLQGLNPDHPVPDDARLALPLTIAGFMLYRALHLGTKASSSATKILKVDPDVVLDVYREIAEGVVILDKCLTDAAGRKIRGEVSAAFLDEFAETTDAAEILLLHAIRLGPEMWRLILRCGLGAHCRLDTPFYVTTPAERAPHGPCRVYKFRKGADHVTLKDRTEKK